LSLLTADYERDEYNTPRIAAAFDGKELYVGIVMKDKLSVEKILEGESRLISTYEKTSPEEIKINGRSAEEIAKEIYKVKYEEIICSASAYRKKGGFELAIKEK
jgi:IMP cyclohydrolase